jgi:FK506-binding nuclear protein
VSGTHTIFLTGNYVIPVDDGPRSMYDDPEDDEYDLSPDEDELLDDEDEESDELDDIPDPRITEVTSEDEEAPKLVAKSKSKRAASDSDEEGVTLDGIISKALKPEANNEKLSKKQQKKLKNNAGAAVAASSMKTETDSPSGKKVSFAKNLEQGPTGSQMTTEKKVNGTTVDKTTGKEDNAPKENQSKASALGVSMVKGVKIDVKKLGSGPAAKKGSKVSMRYIGKLTKDGKQFDGKYT